MTYIFLNKKLLLKKKQRKNVINTTCIVIAFPISIVHWSKNILIRGQIVPQAHSEGQSTVLILEYIYFLVTITINLLCLTFRVCTPDVSVMRGSHFLCWIFLFIQKSGSLGQGDHPVEVTKKSGADSDY